MRRDISSAEAAEHPAGDGTGKGATLPGSLRAAVTGAVTYSVSAALNALKRGSGRLLVPLFAACWVWLLVHFACTAVYLAPVSALKAQLYPHVAAYLLPLFRQRWSLFAPDPDGTTKYLQVACTYEGPEGESVTAPFANVSQRFYERTWDSRLGPDFRLHRAYMTPLVYLDTSAQFAAELLEFRSHREPEAKASFELWQSDDGDFRRRHSHVIAQRIASAECRRHFPEARLLEVQAVVDIVPPPPFAQPGAPAGATRIDFGVQPYVAVAGS